MGKNGEPVLAVHHKPDDIEYAATGSKVYNFVEEEVSEDTGESRTKKRKTKVKKKKQLEPQSEADSVQPLLL